MRSYGYKCWGELVTVSTYLVNPDRSGPAHLQMINRATTQSITLKNIANGR